MKYTKPISVLMKIADPPDASIQSEFAKLEKKRDGFEKKLFDKAKKEFKLITEITAKELQVNLQHELVPFFVVSKNDLKGIKGIIQSNFESKKKKGDMRFLEIDHDDFNKKYPYVNFMKNNTNLMDQVNLNRYTYEKILNMFSSHPVTHDIYYDKVYQNRLNTDSKENEIEFSNELKRKIKANLNSKEESKRGSNKVENSSGKIESMSQFEEKTISTEIFKDKKKKYLKENINKVVQDDQADQSNKSDNNSFNSRSNTNRNNLRKNKSNITKIAETNTNNKETDFDVETCLTLASKFKNLKLNCTPGSENFELLKKQYMSSFLQMSTNIKERTQEKVTEKLKGGEDDFINVKFCKLFTNNIQTNYLK